MESNTLYANIVFTGDHKSKRTILKEHFCAVLRNCQKISTDFTSYLLSLCTDVPPLSEKIGRRDDCESPYGS